MLSRDDLDDCLVMGNEERTPKLIVDGNKNGFNLKHENSLKEYLSCWVIESKDLNQIKILQPHLINSLLDQFGDEVLGKSIHRTPGTPRLNVV
jgi:hypothetical protein